MNIAQSQSPTHRLRLAASLFLVAEAALSICWWILLVARPSARPAFIPAQMPHAVWFAIAPADLVLYALAAAISAWGLLRQKRWATPVLLIHTGAALYAGVWCWSLAASGSGPWLAAALMAPSMVALPAIARSSWIERW